MTYEEMAWENSNGKPFFPTPEASVYGMFLVGFIIGLVVVRRMGRK
jgi:hypothetical protein